MEGIKITDQDLYGNEGVQEVKNRIWSVFSSEGVHLEDIQNKLRGETTLNSYEIDLFPQDEGTRIRVKYGLTSLGLILTIVLLIPGVVFGAILLLFWYVKMDEIKSSLSNAFPGYVPPQRPPARGYNQQPRGEDQKDSGKTPPPPQD